MPGALRCIDGVKAVPRVDKSLHAADPGKAPGRVLPQGRGLLGERGGTPGSDLGEGSTEGLGDEVCGDGCVEESWRLAHEKVIYHVYMTGDLTDVVTGRNSFVTA